MRLRTYRGHDAAATRAVFERAVHLTASRDYTAQQVAAWAPVDRDLAASTAWAAAPAAAHTIVAVEDDEVVGFSDLVHEDPLDMLYVDPRAGGRGIGSALISHPLRRSRRGRRLHRDLRQRHGSSGVPAAWLVVIEQRRPVVSGVAMTNFKMHRVLG